MRACALVLGFGLWAGCGGEIEDSKGPTAGAAGLPVAGAAGSVPAAGTAGTLDPNGPQAGAAAGAAGDPATPGDPPACTPRLPARLVLLGELQHANAIASLLGEDARDPDVQVTAETKPFSWKGLVVGTSLVHGRLAEAEHAAATLAGRVEEITGCAPPGDAACARSFIERFASDAFRRPVDAAEVDDLMTVYELGAETDFDTGVSLAVQAVLSAPSFTYRRELGVPAAGGTVRLTDHELASAVAFMLTDAPPDAELRAAADAGALGDPAELERQVRRMLDEPAVQKSLTRTLMAAWQVGNLFGTVKDPGLFPEYTPALQSSMYRETDAFVQDVLWTRSAAVSELLSSRDTFVDPALATLYGVPYTGSAAGEPVPATLPPERSGLLTQASLLATLSRTDNTSVVARGLFVRGALLCLPKVPGPPSALQDEIQALLAADMTERERAQVRAETSPCGGCHSQFDPFGLLLEGFDPLGRHRTTIDGEAIDTSATLDGLGSFSGTAPDAASFAQQVAASPELTACLTRHLIAYGTADDTLEATACEVTEALDGFGDTAPTMRELVVAATLSSGLSHRTQEAAP